MISHFVQEWEDLLWYLKAHNVHWQDTASSITAGLKYIFMPYPSIEQPISRLSSDEVLRVQFYVNQLGCHLEHVKTNDNFIYFKIVPNWM